MKQLSILICIILLIGCCKNLDEEILGSVVEENDVRGLLEDENVKFVKKVSSRKGVVDIVFGYTSHPGADRLESLLSIQFTSGKKYIDTYDKLIDSGRGFSSVLCFERRNH